ncbi:hypothetical protein Cgig2_027357 [Carnegiea gigantea]|uniref:Uncharacterized protein n=1 Tax=Carnegiea gigantea TaxID=171969 RepID=A0A9Q1GFI1_9CARY|nr:hypothetical protein Cgig2_027357 [Carnegiea gigantea]
MGEYVTRHFAWDRRGVAFPPLPLPKDFQALCPGFELAMAEEAVEYHELSDLPQLYGDRIFEARFRPKVGSGESSGTGSQKEGSGVEPEDEDSAIEKAASQSFIWRWRSASHPPRPLLEDFHVLCPCFSLSEVEGTVADFELPEIVQAIFYAMLLNEAVELDRSEVVNLQGLDGLCRPRTEGSAASAAG